MGAESIGCSLDALPSMLGAANTHARISPTGPRIRAEQHNEPNVLASQANSSRALSRNCAVVRVSLSGAARIAGGGFGVRTAYGGSEKAVRGTDEGCRHEACDCRRCDSCFAASQNASPGVTPVVVRLLPSAD